MVFGGLRDVSCKIEIDENLFEKISNGDNIAFSELYNATDKAVYGFILSILKNGFDAEDIMHDTYMKIRTSSHLYQKQGKPLAWIFTIARNLCLMKFRAEKKNSLNSFDDVQNDIKFSTEMNADDKIIIETAFEILSDEERQIVVMHSLTGLKHREIAEILCIPTSTVLSKYSRAIKKMQEKLVGGDD